MELEEVIEIIKAVLDQAFDYEESLKRENIDHNDVVQLREIVANSPHVPKLMYDKLLIVFLKGNKCDINAAAKCVEKYYELKATCPEFFWPRNLDSPELAFATTVHHMTTLPVSPDNCYVIMLKLVDTDPQNYNYDDLFKLFMMMAENAVMTYGPRDGLIFVLDFTGVSFGHLLRPSISSIMKCLDFVQNGNPLKPKAIHILNTTSLFQILISMLKPFMRSDLFNCIQTHPSDMDYEEFYENHLPRHCLPADYGGELPSMEYLHFQNLEKIASLKKYWIYEEHHLKQQLDNFTDELCEIVQISPYDECSHL
ncbi:alpha-tocopherol transfer protein-like [Chironomus tepperi]|uniref:alpha-tocopherol transfer protein-like n=1 Tax=Chironomus tepperi TaxID=113505 RepID=UPI00391F46A6